jgi:hypothetical protein
MWLKAVFCVVLCSFLCSANKKWDNERSCTKFRNFTPTTPTSQQFLVGQSHLIIEASLSPSDTPHLIGLLWMSDQPDTETYTWKNTTLTLDRHSQRANERPQTHVLHSEATGIGEFRNFQNGTIWLWICSMNCEVKSILVHLWHITPVWLEI